MRCLSPQSWIIGRVLIPLLAVAGAAAVTLAAEPDPMTYWDVNDIRPGMKGTGQTVMVGTKLEEFGAEVLGVMRDVSPGRDMVLCRLTGCNLEHAGIIQGMSGSPIYIDGKLLGAVAFAWEFAKDPIAGVTPFQQMVQYVRSSDRRIAAEAKDRQKDGSQASLPDSPVVDRRPGEPEDSTAWARCAGLGRGAGGHAADRDAAGGVGVQPDGPGAAGRAVPAARHGSDGRRRGRRADRPRGGRQAARPGRAAEHRPGDRRLRPLGHRHRHPRRGKPRLRLRPPDVQPRGLRVPDDDRLHPHGLPPGQRQHEDGLAAEGRRRARHRRQHRRRRPDRPQARHAPAERPGQDRPLRRAAHLSRPDRPRAQPAAHPGHVGPDQRHRHRGEPPRGADRPDQGDDPDQGARPDRAARHRSAAPATPARWAPRRCSARSPRSSTSWSATRWPRSGSSRIDCDVEIAPGRHGRHDRVGPPGLRPARAWRDPQGLRHPQAVQGRAADGRGRPPLAPRPSRKAPTRRTSAT